jgi:hypothetical protein
MVFAIGISTLAKCNRIELVYSNISVTMWRMTYFEDNYIVKSINFFNESRKAKHLQL